MAGPTHAKRDWEGGNLRDVETRMHGKDGKRRRKGKVKKWHNYDQ
jgi:hypothetical protein